MFYFCFVTNLLCMNLSPSSSNISLFVISSPSCLPAGLQKIFLTQGSNWGLPHCRQMLYRLSHQGSPGENYFKEIIRAGNFKICNSGRQETWGRVDATLLKPKAGRRQNLLLSYSLSFLLRPSTDWMRFGPIVRVICFTRSE